MEVTKIRKREDLKNLTEIAKLFYAEELAPYIPQNRVFRSVSVIADYEHNSVFLKTEAGFANQRLQEERPELFTKERPEKGSLIDDITFHVLDRYRDKSDDITTSTLAKLEAAIFYSACSGQLNYLRSHGGTHIKSSAEISVTDLKDVANDIFKAYVHDGKFMLNEMDDQCYIYIELIYGNIFTSESGSEAVDEDDIWNLTEAFRACVLLENKSDCTREDIERYILTAVQAVVSWVDFN